MMKRLATVLLCASVLSAPVFAKDISVKMDQIPAGSWVVVTDGRKSTIQIFRGKQGSNYIVDFVPGKNPNAPRSARDVRDGQGNVLQRTTSDGMVTTYRPHNCQRVVGRCEFVQKTGDQTVKMVRINTQKSKGFTFQQNAIFSDGATAHVQSGTVKSLDKFGLVERASGQRSLDRKKFSMRKVKASWD